jgi:hypothetical protein
MTFDELKGKLALGTEHDLDALFSSFRIESGSEDIELFVSYLMAREIIGRNDFMRLHTDGEVELLLSGCEHDGSAVGQPL